MHSADHSTDTFFFSLLFFLRFTLYLGEDVSHSTLSSLLYSTVTGLTFSQSVASQNLPDHGPQVEWKTLMLFTVMGSFLHETHHLYKLPICTEMPSLLKLHVWKKEVKWILYSDLRSVRESFRLPCTLVQFYLQCMPVKGGGKSTCLEESTPTYIPYYGYKMDHR